MTMKEDLAIKIENISKCYRIGMKEQMHDNIASAMLDFVRSPIRNYRNFRSLYRFDHSDPNDAAGSSDVIWALDDVSFEVKKGEVVGIIGGNGAGKSTILKILSKITSPTYGRAEIRGKISSLLEVGTGFHPDLTGRENIYLNATILGMKKKEVDHKFNDIVEFSGVEKFIDTPVKRYSSGMKVRLAFSVAAHLEPEILIVDEVLSVGDADFQKKSLSKMENIGQEGRTVLFVSHSMSAISRLCSRAILLEKGKVIADGPAHKVVSSYLNSSSGMTAARVWDDPHHAPSGSLVRLRAVRVKTEDGAVTESFDIRYPVRLEMEYDVLQPGHVLLPQFNIVNDRGQCAFSTLDQDSDWRGRPRPSGRYTSTAWIPGNLLAEGMFYVSCYCHTLNPDTKQFMERSAVAFNVSDTLDGDSARGDYAKKLGGVVRPLLKWTTQFDPEGADAAIGGSAASDPLIEQSA
jgi:lipopolysaccharide transport system ATP-binding protein